MVFLYTHWYTKMSRAQKAKRGPFPFTWGSLVQAVGGIVLPRRQSPGWGPGVQDSFAE